MVGPKHLDAIHIYHSFLLQNRKKEKNRSHYLTYAAQDKYFRG